MIDELLAMPRIETEDVTAWREFAAQRVKGRVPIERAILGGATADRLGFAFAGGYAAALAALVPGTDAAALCATESGGNHPRAIRTTFADGRVTGQKKWATLATHAAELLVVATIGDDAHGRPQLRVIRVRTDAPGVTLEASAAPFVPEIPHARVTLTDAPGTALPGDGYTEYLKPFRTVEDIHVHGALVGYLVGAARAHVLDRALIERLIALAIALHALAARDPRSSTTHVALAGLLSLTRATVADLDAAWPDTPERVRWRRDRPLLDVAAAARASRSERAWQSLV